MDKPQSAIGSRQSAVYPAMHQIFLLSPANCSGNRARIVLSEKAVFDLALRLRTREGAPIGDVFAFLSGLYFRGKLAYGRAFARPPDSTSPISGAGVFVITPSAGLRSVDTPVTIDALRAFAGVDIDAANARYRRPLETSARAIAHDIGPDCDVVLLGSIASPKYVDILQAIFGGRLLFPADFVGRGDMSRGGLMLRSVSAGTELPYIPVAGAIRHGKRPAKLTPLKSARMIR
jgi:hypothetical protein